MKVRVDQKNERVTFWCPGCDLPHSISYSIGRWTFNGDVNKPTIIPSIRCFYKRDGKEITTCHSHVIDGQIQFCGDCQHPLYGQTVDLPEIETKINEDGSFVETND